MPAIVKPEDGTTGRWILVCFCGHLQGYDYDLLGSAHNSEGTSWKPPPLLCLLASYSKACLLWLPAYQPRSQHPGQKNDVKKEMGSLRRDIK